MPTWVHHQRRTLWRVAGALYLLFIVVVVWEHRVGPLPAERWLTDHLAHRFDTQAEIGELASFLAYVGGIGVAAPTIATVTWFAWRSSGPVWAMLVPLTLVPGGVAQIVKVATNATELARSSGQVSLANGSVPSGHAAYVTSLFSLIALVALAHRRKDVAAFAVAFVFAVGIALVVRGSHFPGDVLAGVALGAGWTLTCVLIVTRAGAGARRRQWGREGPLRPGTASRSASADR